MTKPVILSPLEPRDARVDLATARLDAETIELNLLGHVVSVSLAYDPETNLLHEVVFVKRPGREGQELHEIFHEFGVQFSRLLQNRCPITGDPATGDEVGV